MKINFISIDDATSYYEDFNGEKAVVNIETYSTNEDCSLHEEECDFSINLKDRCLGNKDYLVRNTLKDSLNVVYGANDLEFFHNLLGESSNEFEFLIIKDFLTWCIRYDKLTVEDLENTNVYQDKIRKSDYEMLFIKTIYNKIYKFISEYKDDSEVLMENEEEHYIVDLEANYIPIGFICNIELKENDKIFLLKEGSSTGLYRGEHIRRFTIDEMSTFMKKASNVHIKDRVEDTFFTNVLLHIMQHPDVKRFIIATDRNTLPDIIHKLRYYLGTERQIYGLYSDSIGAISDKELDKIIYRHDNLISLLEELKQTLGEKHALNVLKSSMYNFYKTRYSIDNFKINKSNNNSGKSLDKFKPERIDSGFNNILSISVEEYCDDEDDV